MAKAKNQNFSYRDYARILAQVAQDLPPLITIEGTEPFLRKTAIEQLRETFRQKFPAGEEKIFYGGAENILAAALNELTGGNLFGGEKLVILRNAQTDFFPQKTSEPALQLFADYWKNPATHNFCVIEIEQINAARVIGKTLNAGAIVPCPELKYERERTEWLRQQAEAHDKKIANNAVALLLHCHGGDLSALADEIEKAAMYLGDNEPEIKLETVRDLLPNLQDFNRFGLTESLDHRDLGAALNYARLLREGTRDEKGKWKDGKDAAHQHLAIIASRFEQLLRAKAALERHENPAEILRLSPWMADKISAATQNFSLAQLAANVETIATEIHASHNTGSDPEFSLDKIITTICG